MRRSRRAAVVAAIAAAALAGAAVIGIVALIASRGDEGSPGPRAAATVTAEAAVRAPAPSPLPGRVPGYRLGAVTISSFRISLVARLRNTILNGLSGGASAYRLGTVRADRDGRSALLVGVGASPDAGGGPLAAQLADLLGDRPVATGRVCGRRFEVHRTPDHALAIAGLGPDRALIAIASRTAESTRLIRSAVVAATPACPGAAAP